MDSTIEVAVGAVDEAKVEDESVDATRTNLTI
jgi:hypothetical protein